MTSHTVTRHMDRVLAPIALSLAQFAVLSALAREPSLSLADLARVLAVRPQSVGELVDRLHRRELVDRSHVGRRGSPVVVWATERGRLLQNRAESQIGTLDDPAEWGLDRRGADELVTLLRAMREALTTGASPTRS